jgi:hypothetical protein
MIELPAKFAWLRPADEEADDTSFRDVVKRTFLARPWINDATFTMAALDNLNRAAAMWDTTVSRDTVEVGETEPWGAR